MPKAKQVTMVSKKQLSATGNVSAKLYGKYIRSGGLLIFIIYFVLQTLAQACIQMQSVTLSNWAVDKYGWTRDEIQIPAYFTQIIQQAIDTYGDHTYIKQAALYCMQNADIQNQYIREAVDNFKIPFSKKYYYLYSGLGVGLIIFFLISVLVFFQFNKKSAENTYKTMLKAIINTKLSFFDTTPQGRVINRLVKDTDSVDFQLGRFFLLAVANVSLIIGMMVTISIITWPCLIVVVPSVVIYILLLARFRSITPQLKRLESKSRSDIFSICQESMDQLTTIRAYNMKEKFVQRFRDLATQNLKVQLYSISISKWLMFRMAIVGSVMAFLISVACMIVAPFDPEISQYAGVIVTYGYIIQQQMIHLIEVFTVTEGEMPAFERMLEYSQLKAETDDVVESKAVKVTPNQGLQISNLVMRYRPDLPTALNGVQIHINKGEHVAVVGRTGSGKSSLAITLFRLYQPEGEFLVLLDDIQISHLPLYESRRQLAIIPQEPYLFSGTVRQQMCEYSRNKAEGLSVEGLEMIPDSKLWELLEVVGMAEYIKQQVGGLDCIVVGNGENFSSGQRQLLCVVRALLRDAEVLILDEATAYVDKETDQIIQNVIKNYLKDKIVISIVHRLDSALGMDKIAVMDSGMVAEFGTVDELLAIQRGIFHELAIKAGIITQK